MLDYVSLEDRLTQRAWRDVRKSPENETDISKRLLMAVFDQPGGCGAPSLLQHVLWGKTGKKASSCG